MIAMEDVMRMACHFPKSASDGVRPDHLERLSGGKLLASFELVLRRRGRGLCFVCGRGDGVCTGSALRVMMFECLRRFHSVFTPFSRFHAEETESGERRMHLQARDQCTLLPAGRVRALSLRRSHVQHAA